MGLIDDYKKAEVNAVNEERERNRKIKVVNDLPHVYRTDKMSDLKKVRYYDSSMKWELPPEIQELFNEAASLIQPEKWIKPKCYLTDNDFVDLNGKHIVPQKNRTVYLRADIAYRCRWSDGSQHLNSFHYAATTDELADGFFQTAADRVLKKVNNIINADYQEIKSMMIPNQERVSLNDSSLPPILFKDGACFGDLGEYYRNKIENIRNYEES